jgi:MoxR-like ATPase
VEEEERIVELVTAGRVGAQLDVSAVSPVCGADDVLALQRLVARLEVKERVRQYAVRIVRETRTWRGVSMGAGPRGGISLVRVARAKALLEGREFVTPDDVKSVALPVLRHRLALAPELELEGIRTDDVLRSILQKVEAPRE